MKTLRTVLITLVTFVILAAAVFFSLSYFKPKPAGISVNTSPDSSVYINGVLAGKTPYNGTFPPGEITLRLVPGVADKNFFPFETKISLVAGIETAVTREFGVDEDSSSGDVISFEKENDANASLVVISTPDNAQVSIDGIPRGFAPYKTLTISPAKHQISVKALGYQDRIMTIKTIVGYKLTVFAKLAKGTAPSPAPSSTPAPVIQTYVEILQTPTGYLRVRTEPLVGGEEIAQVKPGEKYPYLATDAASGWYKIQYEAPKPGLPQGITGWVSNQYSKKIEGTATATPSATPRSTP